MGQVCKVDNGEVGGVGDQMNFGSGPSAKHLLSYEEEDTRM
jgi:hypothetical protein